MHQHRWLFLAVISCGLFLVSADNSILYTALPQLRSQLEATETQALWIINAYPLVLAALLLGTGTLGDKIGHRRMFEIGLSLFSLASLVAALAPNAWVLIGARALLGFGAATMMPATLSLLRLTFRDPQERNKAIGIWGAVATLGAALGPVMGGALLEYFYWGSVFLINIPVALLALVATQRLAPPNIHNPEKHWDLASSVIAMLAMLGMVLFIKELAHSANPIILVISALLAVGAGWLFVARQGRLADPLLTFDVFRNRIFSAGVLTAAVSLFIVAGSEMLTTQRFQLAHGFTPLQAGLVTASMAVAAFPAAILGGARLHMWGFRSIISGGFALLSLGMVVVFGAIVWSTPGTGAADDYFWLFIFGSMIGGFGAGLTMSVASTAIVGSAPRHRAGMASSLEEVSFEFGSLLSVAILGSLFPRFYASYAPAEVADSFEHGVQLPEFRTQTQYAIDMAYQQVVVVVIVVALLAMVATALLLRGNPKETAYAHE